LLFIANPFCESVVCPRGECIDKSVYERIMHYFLHEKLVNLLIEYQFLPMPDNIGLKVNDVKE
jgi:hypothetical protein